MIPAPAMFKRVQTPFGPMRSQRTFLNDSQMHCAWETYAKKLSPKESQCTVRVEFDDGSSFEEILEREDKTLEYKGYDGEVWEARYEGKRWVLDDEVSTSPLAVVKRAYNLDKTAKVSLV